MDMSGTKMRTVTVEMVRGMVGEGGNCLTMNLKLF
jgi:hypothetical protein